MRRLSCALGVLLVVSCSHDTTGADTGQFRLDTDHAVSDRIGSVGGTLTTTDGQGRTYQLRIPAGALRESTTVTLTPVSELPEFAGGVSLRAAAHFTPEGTRLMTPGVLKVWGAGATHTTGDLRLAGFAYTGQGASPYRSLLGFAGDTIVVPVLHFSGAGAAVTSDASLIPAPPTSADETTALWHLAAIASISRYQPGYGIDQIIAVFEAWYHDLVEPALQLASNDTELSNAVHYYLAWEQMLACGSDTCSSVNVFDESGAAPSPHYFWTPADDARIRAGLASTRAAAHNVFLNALEQGITRSTQQCRTGHDLQAGANAEYWAKWDVVYGGNASDPVAQCVSVVIEQVTFPTSVSQGQAAQLQVKAGLLFVGDAAPVHNFNLAATVNSSGATPATSTGLTATGSGLYTTTLTPDGSGPVFLGIRAAWVLIAGQLTGLYRDTTAEATLNSRITITPTAAILNTSTQATFTATVTGLASTGVTWSATGGTLSATSGPGTTYTSGITPGTYSITATAVADPSQHVSAQITIVGPSTPVGGRIQSVDGRLDPFAQGLFTACTENDVIAPTAVPASLAYSATATCPEITESDDAGHTGSGFGTVRQSFQVVTSTGTVAGDLSSITIDGEGTGTASGYSGMGEGSSRMALCFSIPGGVTWHYQLSGSLNVTGASYAQTSLTGPVTFSYTAGEDLLTGQPLPPSVSLNSTGALPGGFYCFDARGVASASVYNGAGVTSANVKYSNVTLRILP